MKRPDNHYEDLLRSVAFGPLQDVGDYYSKVTSHVLLELAAESIADFEDCVGEDDADDAHWVPYRKAGPLVREALAAFRAEHKKRKAKR